ncbi:unnamed protein product [Urochloa humidicola]
MGRFELEPLYDYPSVCSYLSDSDSASSDSASDTDSGERKRKRSLARSLDYECVERFRLRLLLAFLRLHGYDSAFEALSKETAVLFRAGHLQHLVQQGLCSDAIRYIYRFMRPMRLPKRGMLLVEFIFVVSRISDRSYKYDPHSPYQMYLHGGVSPGGVKLAKIISAVHSEHAWSSIDWSLVRNKAAEIVGQLVAQIPEFNEMCRLPFCSAKPANVLPIGLSSRGHKGLQKKSLGRMPADAVAQSFLSKRRRTSSSKGTTRSDLPLGPVTMTRLAELIEECLQAGKRVVFNGKHSIESSCTEGKEIAAWAVHDDVVSENNLRPHEAEHQVFETRKQMITGKLCQAGKEIATWAVHDDVVSENNPRPHEAEHQVFETRKQLITGKLCQAGFRLKLVYMLFSRWWKSWR